MKYQQLIDELIESLEQYKSLIIQLNALDYNASEVDDEQQRQMLNESKKNIENYLNGLWSELTQDYNESFEKYLGEVLAKSKSLKDKYSDDPITVIQIEESINALESAKEPADYFWPLSVLIGYF